MCGEELAQVIRWTRLVTEEPVTIEFKGPWGNSVEVDEGGTPELKVFCPTCGIASTVGRNWPLAAA